MPATASLISTVRDGRTEFDVVPASAPRGPRIWGYVLLVFMLMLSLEWTPAAHFVMLLIVFWFVSGVVERRRRRRTTISVGQGRISAGGKDYALEDVQELRAATWPAAPDAPVRSATVFVGGGGGLAAHTMFPAMAAAVVGQSAISGGHRLAAASQRSRSYGIFLHRKAGGRPVRLAYGLDGDTADRLLDGIAAATRT